MTANRAEHVKVEMHAAHNPLAEDKRVQLTSLLNGLLCCSIDLEYQVRTAHWNMKGSNFIGLHKLADEIAEVVEKYVDLIAERLTALGGQTNANVQAVVEHTRLSPYSTKLVDTNDHVRALADTMSVYSKHAYEGIAESEKLDDPVTADMLVDVAKDIDKYVWLLESHVVK